MEIMIPFSIINQSIFSFVCFSFVCSQRVVDLAHLVASKWPGAGSGKSGDPLEDFCQTNPADEECKVYEA